MSVGRYDVSSMLRGQNPYKSVVEQLLQQYPIISDQVDRAELGVILREFEKTLIDGVEGDVVEFGCYIGTTSLFLRRMLDAYHSDKALHAYDSFEGLPEKSTQDQSVAGDQFRAGELTVSKKQLLREFQKAGLKPPIVHKGWFGNLTSTDIPNRISFAFLDGDFYNSIMDSLKLVWPRLTPTGTIAIDDYAREALPGAERAVHEFFRGKNVSIRHSHSIAVVKRST